MPQPDRRSPDAAITHSVQACYDNGESWNLVCDCQWEAWEQPDEETARRLHARHVADEGSPAAWGLVRVKREWVPDWLWRVFCVGNLATFTPWKEILTRRAHGNV